MNGEQVGTWTLSAQGQQLSYSEIWRAARQGRPLSISLPFLPGNRSHRGAAVAAYFDNLLPDSRPIRERLASRFRAASTDAFDLLAQTGRDCVGALQIVPAGADPGDVRRIQGNPLDEAGVARELGRAVAAPSRMGFLADDDEFRISIAGAQEKTALLRHAGQWMRPQGATPTTHILKLPMGLVGNMQLDLQHSVENEWLCAQIIEAYGLPVARCAIGHFEQFKALVVERFDRMLAPDGSWLLRLPQEDMCQATATPSHLKYEADGGPGMNRILGLLGGSNMRDADRHNFFKAQLLFWLMCAPDGHAKNFSIALQAGGSYRMTPLYDVMSAYPVLGSGASQISPHKVRLAMAVRSENAHWRMREIQRRHWSEVARQNALSEPAESIIAELLQDTPRVVDEVSRRLPKGFPARIADTILAGLRDAAERLDGMPYRSVDMA